MKSFFPGQKAWAPSQLRSKAVFARRVWSPRVSHDGHDRDVQGPGWLELEFQFGSKCIRSEQ